MGKYECFFKGDWEKGVSNLALGKDDNLKAVAAMELKRPASSTEQAKLGDDWWDLAEKQEGVTRLQMQQRAAYWYQKAMPGLSGLTKAKVEKRLGQLVVAPAPTKAKVPSSARPLAIVSALGRRQEVDQRYGKSQRDSGRRGQRLGYDRRPEVRPHARLEETSGNQLHQGRGAKENPSGGRP